MNLIDWFADQPVMTGAITFLLMWTDWILTILQEGERTKHYHKHHYKSYPINTIEGNPGLQNAVSQRKLIHPRHNIYAFILSGIVGLASSYIHDVVIPLFLGFVWGIFLLVITQHISNFIGYRMSRKGVRGTIHMHQRTGYQIQAGRYLSLAVLFTIISLIAGNLFLYGLTLAAFISSLRMLLYIRKIPKGDKHLDGANTE